MELVDGPSARALQRRVGALQPAVAAWIVEQAALGLQAAHAREIVHRDVKPDNILIDATGGVKLADLGLARPMDGRWILTAHDHIVGTPAYMAPEQWRNADIGRPADVFGLGTTLYSLLTGSTPVEGDSLLAVAQVVSQREWLDPATKCPGIPAALSAVVRRATACNPLDRFPDAGAMAAELCAVRRGDLATEDAVAAEALHELCSRTRPDGRGPRPALASRPGAAAPPPVVAPAHAPPRSVVRRSMAWRGMVWTVGGAAAVTTMVFPWSPRTPEPRGASASIGASLPIATTPEHVAEPGASVGAEDQVVDVPPPASESAPAASRDLASLRSPPSPAKPAAAIEYDRPGPVATAAAARKYRERFVDPQSGIEFVLVPAGALWFGYTPGDPWPRGRDLRQSRTTVERPFYLSRTEVTRDQYALHRTPRSPGSPGSLPIVDVSRDEAIGFCQRLGYRLPTELEWEHACRAGTATRFWWGDDEAAAAAFANALSRVAGVRPLRATFPAADGFEGLAPVAQKLPNAFDLYDMTGNVWEMCADADASSPSDAPMFVVRGGSWREGPDVCRCSGRSSSAANYRADNLGFRVALDPGGQHEQEPR
jgi:formylglycine-generating enzyme required for sulfatase activity